MRKMDNVIAGNFGDACTPCACCSNDDGAATTFPIRTEGVTYHRLICEKCIWRALSKITYMKMTCEAEGGES